MLLLLGVVLGSEKVLTVSFSERLITGGYGYAFGLADADLDVVAMAWGKDGRVVWFENPGNPHGKWTRHVLKTAWVNANQVLVADGDGRPDIAATAERSANELRWWRNEGRRAVRRATGETSAGPLPPRLACKPRFHPRQGRGRMPEREVSDGPVRPDGASAEQDGWRSVLRLGPGL